MDPARPSYPVSQSAKKVSSIKSNKIAGGAETGDHNDRCRPVLLASRSSSQQRPLARPVACPPASSL